MGGRGGGNLTQVQTLSNHYGGGKKKKQQQNSVKPETQLWKAKLPKGNNTKKKTHKKKTVRFIMEPQWTRGNAILAGAVIYCDRFLLKTPLCGAAGAVNHQRDNVVGCSATLLMRPTAALLCGRRMCVSLCFAVVSPPKARNGRR